MSIPKTCLEIVHTRDFTPEVGRFCSKVVIDDATRKVWLYSSSGDYVQVGIPGYSFRYSSQVVQPNSDVPINSLTGKTALVGDLILDTDSNLYQIVKINHGADTVTVGDLLANLSSTSLAPGNDGDFFVTLDKQTQWEPVNIIGEEI